MRGGWKWLAAAGAGALGMYLLDPDRGRRRRAMWRDRARHQLRATGKGLGSAARAVVGRSRALLSKAPRPFEPVSDEVLAERVRSQIGHVVSKAGAVEAAVRDGRVTLSGQVYCGEVRRLLRRVAHVPGVTHVENELEACEARAAQG